MKSVANFFACAALTACLAGFSVPAALAANGEDFPGTTVLARDAQVEAVT